MNRKRAQTDQGAADEALVNTIANLSDRLRQTGGAPLTLSDIIGVAELLTQSLQPLLRRIDVTLHRELRGILERIEKLRSDISRVHAQDISQHRIPEVGKELNEVVRATESATNAIMEAAEAVLAAPESSPDDYRAFVADEMMKIFEACSFQDITGQRVNRVVETVEVIEERINLLCNMIDTGVAPHEKVLTPREEEKKEQMLNGPRSNGAAQAEIDAMF